MLTDKIEWDKLQKERMIPIRTVCECGKPIFAKGFCHSCYNVSLREHQKRKVVSHYSPDMECSCCGENRMEFLTIDHINGGGKKHRKEIKRNSIYSWLIKNNFPEGFQVLCYNCNMCKGMFGECYHKNPEISHISKYVYNRRYKVLSHYSQGTPKCICCGEDIFYFLSMDHINGGGTKHVKELNSNNSNSRTFYFWLIKNGYPDGFRVLCHNCNCSLGRYHYCPHHPECVPIPIFSKYNDIDESIFA